MLNDNGEQIIDEDDDIMGQDVDEGSIYDDSDSGDSDEIDDDTIVDEDKPEPKRPNHLEERLNEMASARHQSAQKNEELQHRLYDLEKSNAMEKTVSNASRIETEIKEAQSKKEIYLEDGNFGAISDIDSELHNLHSQKQHNDTYRGQIERAQYQPDPEPAPPPVQLPDNQVKWMEDNKWFNKMQGKTAYANETYDELILDGYDPEDQKTYDELNKRIGNKTSSGKPRNEQAPSPGNSEVGDGPTRTSRKDVLNNNDLKKMRKWGIDTNDKEARAEWLRNKRRANQEFA